MLNPLQIEFFPISKNCFFFSRFIKMLSTMSFYNKVSHYQKKNTPLPRQYFNQNVGRTRRAKINIFSPLVQSTRQRSISSSCFKGTHAMPRRLLPSEGQQACSPHRTSYVYYLHLSSTKRWWWWGNFMSFFLEIFSSSSFRFLGSAEEATVTTWLERVARLCVEWMFNHFWIVLANWVGNYWFLVLFFFLDKNSKLLTTPSYWAESWPIRNLACANLAFYKHIFL